MEYYIKKSWHLWTSWLSAERCNNWLCRNMCPNMGSRTIRNTKYCNCKDSTKSTGQSDSANFVSF